MKERIRSTTILFRLAAAALLCAVFFCCAEVCCAAETESYTMENGTILTYTYKTGKAVSLTGVTPGAGVENLVLPDELDGKRIIEIREDAFAGCDGLKTLFLPKTVTTIYSNPKNKAGALDGCTSLESITVAEENPAFFSRDGVLFRYGSNEDGNTDSRRGFMDSCLVVYPPEKPDVSYMIPFGVTSVLGIRSNHLEVVEAPGAIKNYFLADSEDLPVLNTIVFYQKVQNLEMNPQLESTRKTIVLGSGDRLTGYDVRDANIVSFTGSDAERWADEMEYSFTALPKPNLDMGDLFYETAIDYHDTIKLKISSDLPYETASENEEAAVMDQKVKVTVKRPGETRLHASVRYDGEHLPADDSIGLIENKACILSNQNPYTVKSGTRTVQLIPVDEYPGLNLKYRSMDESKLTVDQNGKVTLLTTKPGTYFVDIINEQETDLVDACSYTCVIEIDHYEQTITLGCPGKGIVGKTMDLKASAKGGLTQRDFFYTSQTPKIAKVSADGKVTFLHPGIAIIRIQASQSRLYKEKFQTFRIRSVLGKPRLKVKNTGGHSARITWSKVSGAKKYLVYVRYPGQKKYKLAVKKSAKVKGIRHRNLKKGKKYSYKVRAYVKYNGKKYYSPYSKAVTIKAN